MCYELAISTNAPIDLRMLNKVDVFFERTVAEQDKTNLHYPNCYRVITGMPTYCSCIFRIFEKDMVEKHGFQWVSEEWLEEELIDKLDTEWLFQIIKNLVNQGYQVDSYVSEYNKLENIAEKIDTIHVNDTDKVNFVFYDSVRFEYVR